MANHVTNEVPAVGSYRSRAWGAFGHVRVCGAAVVALIAFLLLAEADVAWPLG